MVSGASPLAYWTANYLVDVVFHLIPASAARLCIYLCDIDAPQSEIVFLNFALVNPVFVYALSFVFDTEMKASILIRVSYFVMGGLGPIAVHVL